MLKEIKQTWDIVSGRFASCFCDIQKQLVHFAVTVHQRQDAVDTRRGEELRQFGPHVRADHVNHFVVYL